MKTLILTTAVIAGLTTAALAHSDKKTSIPADGEVLKTSPEEIVLNFDDPMRITVLKLTGPDGEVPLARTDGMKPVEMLEATPEAPIAPGTYAIEWRGLGRDGHVMEGFVDFEVAR